MMTTVEPVSTTETVILTALKVNLPTARANVADWARALELQVDDIHERPRLLSTELTVTVTGPSEQIDAYPARLGGGGLVSEAGGPPDALLNGLLEDGVEGLQRWRRSRRRRPRI
jgi:hypothetical protein